MNLFINACVREQSRTLRIAREILKEYDDEFLELDLNEENVQPLSRWRLMRRDRLLGAGKLDAPMFRYAHQFAEADEIVIAAPYWDIGFPAILKIYLENVTVAGVTFRYNNNKPVGLCKVKQLTYITTAGGLITSDFGYSYVRALVKGFFGVGKTRLICAQNLDVDGITVETVMDRVERGEYQ